jgi:phosphoribosylglycinamide formyltransferase-1
VLPGDDEDALAARVLVQEHRIYPQAVSWFVADRLSIDAAGRVDVRAESAGPTGWTVPPVEA